MRSNPVNTTAEALSLPTKQSGNILMQRNVPIEMADGIVLRADVFRPDDGESRKFPAILAMSPYGKDYHMELFQPTAWKDLQENFPEIHAESSCKYIVWETLDPERFVPRGYVLVRIDARGWGRSPGVAEHLSAQMGYDYCQAIEWAATQAWCNGKVGISGISYYSWMNWQVAALNPPHLAAVVIWEGSSDYYREIAYHGGIRASSPFGVQRTQNQHGLETAIFPGYVTGAQTGPDRPTGPEILTKAQLDARRGDLMSEFRAHKLDDALYKSRSPRLENIRVPILISGNWGGQGLHLRGATEGFRRVASTERWLELHTGTHWQEYYKDYGVRLQQKFFDHFLKGEPNGWDREPRVLVAIRHPDKITRRGENEYPLARTRYTKFYLDAGARKIATTNSTMPAKATFEAMFGFGVQFMTEPLKEDTEILGPVGLRLWISSSTTDADLFAILQVYRPDGSEVTFVGAYDPRGPISMGWLRMSHRKLDPDLSTPARPYHPHDVIEKLVPGEIYPADVEIWPTSIVVPKGHRIGLLVDGKDYVNSGIPLGPSDHVPHKDLQDRPIPEFAGTTTIHTGGRYQSYLVLPVIP
jgi:uncharacterized protein